MELLSNHTAVLRFTPEIRDPGGNVCTSAQAAHTFTLTGQGAAGTVPIAHTLGCFCSG
jgi:hypothetical protein